MKHITDTEPFDFNGLQIRDLTAGLDTGASIAEIDIVYGTSHETARSTRSDKYYLCIEGNLSFRVEGRDIRLGKGELLIINRGEWFSYENPGENDARLVLVHVPPFDMESEQFRSQTEQEEKN